VIERTTVMGVPSVTLRDATERSVHVSVERDRRPQHRDRRVVIAFGVLADAP
jgi:hypothetical protein